MIDVKSLVDVETDVHHCVNCDLARKINPYPFSHFVDLSLPEVKYLFIGRNPGLEHSYPKDATQEQYRALYQKNFIESSFGKYLASAVGVDVLKASMFTNAVKCPTFNNAEPSTAHYVTCSTHLFKQIDAVKARKIFVFGRSIVRSLSIACGVAKLPIVSYTYKGFNKMDVIEYENLNASRVKFSLILLYHPSYFERGGNPDLGKRQIALLKSECSV
jgi:uracil-DNA glycosylase